MVTSKPANGPHPGQEFVLPCRLLFRQGHLRESLESSPRCGFRWWWWRIPIGSGWVFPTR